MQREAATVPSLQADFLFCMPGNLPFVDTSHHIRLAATKANLKAPPTSLSLHLNIARPVQVRAAIRHSESQLLESLGQDVTVDLDVKMAPRS